MLPIKIISAVVAVGGVGGAIGGIVHLTSRSKSGQGATLEQTTTASGVGWRNYLVQAKTTKPDDVTEPLNTCVFNSVCKVYSRQDGDNSSSAKSNLTLVKAITTITSDAYYVLSINSAPLKINTLVEITSDEQKVWAQITSKISIPSGNYKMPKPPKTSLAKSAWIDMNTIELHSANELPKLQNRLFNNQHYPDNLTREDVDHQSYMVLKWQETYVGVNSTDSPHPNKIMMLYIPKDQKDLPKSSQPENTGDGLGNLDHFLSMPFMHPAVIPEYPSKPGQSMQMPRPSAVNDKDLVPVDSYLFKTFEEQKSEIDDQGIFELSLSEISTGVVTGKSPHKKELFTDTYIEIYEISDQTNIAKSFVSSPDNEDKSLGVNWDSINKDKKMITKLSALEHGKYYKFVFSDEKVIDKVLGMKLTDFSGGLKSKLPMTPSKDHKYTPVFRFSNTFKDFYCIKKASETKCQPF